MTKAQQLHKVKKPRRKRCKECNKLFTPTRKMQPCCSFDCEIKYINKPENLKKHIGHGKKLRRKEEAKKKKEATIDSKGGLKEKTQKVVNRYIRLRDKYKPCVSCGKSEAMQFDAGHYENVHGHPQLRFNTLNIHKQCSHCNCQLSANKVPYREELIRRIGIEKVEKLERDHSIKKYDVEYLERLRKLVNKKIKLYERKFR